MFGLFKLSGKMECKQFNCELINVSLMRYYYQTNLERMEVIVGEEDADEVIS